MFWGLTVNNTTACNLPAQLKNKIKLSHCSATQLQTPTVSLYIQIDEKQQYSICKLIKNQKEDCILDLTFYEGQNISFILKDGEGVVDLTGHYEITTSENNNKKIANNADQKKKQYFDESDEESDEFEDIEDQEQFGSDDEEEDDDEEDKDLARERKKLQHLFQQEQTPQQAKKKAQPKNQDFDRNLAQKMKKVKQF